MSDVEMDAAGRRPVMKYTAGGVSIAIWQNRRQAEGRTWDTFSCQIQNRYLDDAGIWQDSEYYSPANLADLHLLTLRALMFTRVRERETQAPESASAVRPV